jgi:hypothetical protein
MKLPFAPTGKLSLIDLCRLVDTGILRHHMPLEYKISLVARNEGIEYRDASGIYRFDVEPARRLWKVYLPGSKGDNYDIHELSDLERRTILPRIEQFLSTLKYFKWFGPTYPVSFVNHAPKTIIP